MFVILKTYIRDFKFIDYNDAINYNNLEYLIRFIETNPGLLELINDVGVDIIPVGKYNHKNTKNEPYVYYFIIPKDKFNNIIIDTSSPDTDFYIDGKYKLDFIKLAANIFKDDIDNSNRNFYEECPALQPNFEFRRLLREYYN